MKIKSITVLTVFLLVGVIVYGNYKKNKVSYTNLEYYRQFLGEHIDSIPQIANYTTQKHKELGDEGLEWRSVSFYNGCELLLTMETNWLDTMHISRISFYSNTIKFDDVHPGQIIGTSKKRMHYVIEPCQDGYLLLRPEKYSDIFMQIDLSGVSSISALWYGECCIDEVPDTLHIESIILSANK